MVAVGVKVTSGDGRVVLVVEGTASPTRERTSVPVLLALTAEVQVVLLPVLRWPFNDSGRTGGLGALCDITAGAGAGPGRDGVK